MFTMMLDFKSVSEHGLEKISFSVDEKRFEVFFLDGKMYEYNVENNDDESIPIHSTLGDGFRSFSMYKKNSAYLLVDEHCIFSRSAFLKFSIDWLGTFSFDFADIMKIEEKYMDDKHVQYLRGDLTGEWTYIDGSPKVTKFRSFAGDVEEKNRRKKIVEKFLCKYAAYQKLFTQNKGKKYIENILQKKNKSVLDFKLY